RAERRHPHPEEAPATSPTTPPVSANETLVRSAAKIQLKTDGSTTKRARSPRVPPITCTAFTSSGSTERIPRYVLKKTTKNTVKRLSAIFDAIPRPSQGRRIGATAMRGSELSETSTGSTTSEARDRKSTRL